MALVNVLKVSRTIQVFRPLKKSFVSKPIVLLKNASVCRPVDLWSCPASSRFLSSDAGDFPQPIDVPTSDHTEKMKKKGLKSPQITLIMPDERVTNDTLDHAEKLAKRRDLKLVKILDFDTKSQRPLYRLMSNLEFVQEAHKAREEKKKRYNQKSDLKDEKLFILSSKINENDLSFKINQMQKLSRKRHPIRVFISQDGSPTKAEELVKVIEDELKHTAEKKSQVRKATTLKLQFTPKRHHDEVNSSQDESSKNIEESDEVDKNNARKVKN